MTWRNVLIGGLLLSLGWTAPALADQILVLSSANLPLYNRAVNGVTGAFRMDRGEHVRVVRVDELTDPSTGSGQNMDGLDKAAVDVIVAVGAKAARYAAEHYASTPIIYCMVVRPEQLTLTPYSVGVSMFVPVSDMLATLQLVSPNLRHVGVLHSPAQRGMLQEAVKQLGGYEVRLMPVEVSDPRQLPKLARRLVLQSDALWVAPGTIDDLDAMQFLLKLSFEHRVPLVADSPALVRAGALLAVVPDPVDLGRQAGRLAGYLLSGEGLPPDRMFYPDMANLAINLKTARNLGIEVPQLLQDFASVVVP